MRSTPERRRVWAAITLRALVYALAVRGVVRQKPEIFGDVHDLADYDGLVEEHKSRLAELFEMMEQSFTGEDLIFGRTSLTSAQRDAGLIKVSFKRAPDVVLTPGWPERLLREVMDKSNKKAKAA